MLIHFATAVLISKRNQTRFPAAAAARAVYYWSVFQKNVRCARPAILSVIIHQQTILYKKNTTFQGIVPCPEATGQAPKQMFLTACVK
jgi:hypothetical protein